jgi:hypothetical protein
MTKQSSFDSEFIFHSHNFLARFPNRSRCRGRDLHGTNRRSVFMHYSREYPANVQDVIDDDITYKSDALRSVQDFARSKPWRGSLDERHMKIRTLHNALCKAYDLDPHPRVIFGNDHLSCSGASCFVVSANAIVLRGRLSVVTYLHEFAHARGMNERQACAWSINLFRKCFPRSWSRVRFDGHMVRTGEQP